MDIDNDALARKLLGAREEVRKVWLRWWREALERVVCE